MSRMEAQETSRLKIAEISATESDSFDYNVECPSCGPAERNVFGICNGLPIVTCGSCGLMYVGIRPDASDTEEFFRDEYIDNDDRAGEGFVNYRAASLRNESAIIRSALPEGGQLLDVGAATGVFLDQFTNDPQWDVTGVEPSKGAVNYARREFGIELDEGFLHEQKYANEQFDAVTSLDTFAFHPDPNADLQEINRVLRHGGLFAIEIAGLNFRLLKNSGPVCRLIYGRDVCLNAGIHLYYYNRHTLTQLLARHGFELVSVHPERMPVYGNPLMKTLKAAYFHATGLAYKLTGGWLNLVPKEFLIYRKAADAGQGTQSESQAA